jgi:hypothetical protein
MANNSRTGGNRPEQTGAAQQTGTSQTTGTGSTTHFATDMKNRAQETASQIADQAKSTASNLADKAQNLASNLGQKAQDAASNLGDRADDALSSVGGQMKNLAGTLRQNTPHEGMTGQAASAVAQGLEGAGSYLQQHGIGDMTDDLSDVIRRYPIPAVLIGIGVGFLLAKATRS